MPLMTALAGVSGAALAYARSVKPSRFCATACGLAFAFLGSVILMLVFCYGITLDIEELDFAVLDLSQGPESRAYICRDFRIALLQPNASH